MKHPLKNTKESYNREGKQEEDNLRKNKNLKRIFIIQKRIKIKIRKF